MKKDLKKIRTRKTAFTMAEVLITLGIIGVVAAMTIPTIIGIGKQHAWDKQKTVVEQKFREATAQMKVASALSGHASTEAFLKEFGRYMKLAKTCDNNNIQDCYAPKIILGADDEAEVSELTTSSNLGHDDYNTNTAGVVMLDGVSIILAYDPKCEPIDPSDNTKDTLACLSMVYDINGKGSPNQIGRDIVTINAAITTCDVKIGNLCTMGGDVAFTPITIGDPRYQPCMYIGQDTCASDGNYWQGAGEACKALGMRLPSLAELAQMASDQYGTGRPIGANEGRYDLTWNASSKLNMTQGSNYWSAGEYGTYEAYVRYFDTTSSFHSYTIRSRSITKARCVK